MSKYPQYQKRAVLKAASDIAGGKVAVHLDVYDVLQAFGITNPAQAHAVKKILRAGKDHLSFEQDIQEVKDSLDRAVELDGFRELKEDKPSEIILFWKDDHGGLYRGEWDKWADSFHVEYDVTKWTRQASLIHYRDRDIFHVISEAEARKLVEQAGGVW